MTRNTHLHIRLSAPERDDILASAKQAGLAVSEYVRTLAAKAKRAAEICPKCKGRGVL